MKGQHTRPDNATMTACQLVLSLVTGVLLALTGGAAPFAIPGGTHFISAATAQNDSLPPRNDDPSVRVHDPADYLTESQEARLNSDLDRLHSSGTEGVIFVRHSSDDATGSPTFAQDLRLGWGVETVPGADDGIVFVLTVQQNDEFTARIDYSVGTNTLPIARYTLEDLEKGLEIAPDAPATLTPFVEAISFAARRMTNTIYDQVGILTPRQATTLHGDLQRLRRLGVPAVIYIRSTNDESAASSAEQILVDWGVESSPGADDGLVFFLTVDPRDPERSSFDVASGANTYPIRQLDGPEMEQIAAADVLPNVHAGDEYLGLAFAVRRTINFAEYSPPSPPSLTSTQGSLQTPLNVVAALLVQVAMVGYFLAPVVRERRLALLAGPRTLVEYGLVIAILAVIVGTAGILARNPASTLSGLGVFVWASCGIPVIHQAVTRRARQSATGSAAVVPSLATQSPGGHDVVPAR